MQNFLKALGDTHIFCAFDPKSEQFPKENTSFENLKDLNDKGYGIYYCVNQMALPRSKENCLSARAIWVDDDNIRDEPRTDFPLKPSVVVNTSKGKYQYLWITQCDDLAEWDLVQLRMVADWGCDTKTKDRARILRLPGFNHTKENPYPVTYTGDLNKYDWNTIKEHFPPVEVTSEVYKASNESTPWKERIEQIKNGDSYHDNIIALLTGMAKDGLEQSLAESLIESVLNNATNKDERWQKRIEAIKENANSVYKKFGKTVVDVSKILNKSVKKELEPFPVDVLPTRLNKAAIEISRVVQVPVEVPTIALLSYFMNALGHKTVIYEKSYHKLLPSLGFILMLKSGERKSGVLNMLHYIINDCKKHSYKEYQKNKATFKTRKKLFDKDMKALEKELDKTSPLDVKQREAVILKIQELATNEPIDPAFPRIEMDDATEESIRDAIIDNEGTLLVHSADGRAIMNTIMGRYKGDGGTGESIFIKGIANDPIDNHRVGKKDEVIRSVSSSCLNLMCMVQPDLVYKLLSKSSFAVSGLVARLLFIEPETMVGKRLEHVEDKPYDPTYTEAMHDVIMRAYKCNDLTVYLDDESVDARREYSNYIETTMLEGGKYAEESDFVNKTVSNAVRLGSVYYILDNPDSIVDGGKLFLPVKYLNDGIKTMQYFINKSIELVRNSAGEKITSVALDVLYAAHKNFGKEKFMAGNLHKFITLSKREHINDAIDTLYGAGCVEFRSKGKGIEVQLTELGIEFCEWDKADDAKKPTRRYNKKYEVTM